MVNLTRQTEISEEEVLKNLVKPFYSDFYNIESFLRMDSNMEYREAFWNMTAPHFKMGEARYYPLKFNGRLIETTLVDPPWTNNSIAIGKNAGLTTSSNAIAIGSSANSVSVGIGSYSLGV